jgi:hypothetical protein
VKGSQNVQNVRVQIGQKDAKKGQSEKEQNQEAIEPDTQPRIQGLNVCRRLIPGRNPSIPAE